MRGTRRTFTIDEILDRSAKKLNMFSKNLFQNKRGDQLRDPMGVATTQNRIMKSIENFADSGMLGSGNYTLVNEAILKGCESNSKRTTNYSVSESESLYDLDVVDISLGVTISSDALSYFAADRAMSAVKQSINFQGLIAENNAGGFTKGSVVYDPRSAISTALNMSRSSAEVDNTAVGEDGSSGEKTLTVSFASPTPVVANETKIYAYVTASGADTAELIGFTSPMDKPALSDGAIGSGIVAGDQEVSWKKGGFFTTGKININTGTFTAKYNVDLSTYTIIVKTFVDRGAEKDGAHTLRLKPVMMNHTLQAKETMVFLDISLETQAVMNKILRENAKYGLDVDYSKRAIDQLIDIYTYSVNLKVTRSLWEGVQKLPLNATLDLTGYTASYSTFSTTKNDRILAFMNKLSTDLLFTTNHAVTAWAVDDIAARVLANDTDNFKVDAGFRARRDGFIGYYAGIPVIRSAYLDGKVSSEAGDGVVIGVHKSLDGQIAPVFYGDYLAPYSSIPSLNYNNPTQMSQALMSNNACECLVPEFTVKGKIKAGSY